MGNNKTKRCIRCNKLKVVKSNFVKGFDSDGYSFICNDCRFKVNTYDKLKKFCRDDKRKFNEELWEKCLERSAGENDKEEKIIEVAISDYFRQMNFPQNREKLEEKKKGKKQEYNDDIPKELIIKWGRFKNYTLEDYEFLEENYNSWITECKSDTLAEKKLYKEICLKELEIRKLREDGKPTDKQVDTLQKLMDAANVKPKDANAANDPSNNNVLGLIIKDIEQYRPAEYFEDKKTYSDFDNMKDYLQRFVFRPLKNLLLGSRDFDKEFNIEQEA